MPNGWGNTAAGGTSDAQAGNDRTRSKQIKPTDYDPAMSIARDFAKREALKTQNANRIEVEQKALAWAEGQIDTWRSHATMSKGQTEIDLARWLELNYAAEKAGIGQYGQSGDFLATLDQQRAKNARDAIKEADQRYLDHQRPGYQEPAPRIPNEPGIDAAEGRTIPEPMTEAERAIRSFKAERKAENNAALEAWCRAQLRAYREYLANFSAKSLSPRLTPEEWLKTNFRAVRKGAKR